MTSRLEKALRRLPPEAISEVEDFAEFLAAKRPEQSEPPRFLALDWAGKAADAYPEHQSGVEAAHAALEMRRRAIERSLSHDE